MHFVINAIFKYVVIGWQQHTNKAEVLLVALYAAIEATAVSLIKLDYKDVKIVLIYTIIISVCCCYFSSLFLHILLNIVGGVYTFYI